MKALFLRTKKMDNTNIQLFLLSLDMRKNRIDKENFNKEKKPSLDKITMIKALKGIIESNDLKSFYNIELSYLQNEKDSLTITKQKDNSLNRAIRQLEEGKKSLDSLLQDKDVYIKGLDYFTSETKDNKGLPIDGMRLYFKSQNARLVNDSKGIVIKEDKETLKVRNDCLKAFKKTYIERQTQVLGVALNPLSNTTKGQQTENIQSSNENTSKDTNETESTPIESKPKKRRRMR